MRGSLHYGGKSAAFGRDDDGLSWKKRPILFDEVEGDGLSWKKRPILFDEAERMGYPVYG
jgi:hypothetical protein